MPLQVALCADDEYVDIALLALEFGTLSIYTPTAKILQFAAKEERLMRDALEVFRKDILGGESITQGFVRTYVLHFRTYLVKVGACQTILRNAHNTHVMVSSGVLPLSSVGDDPAQFCVQLLALRKRYMELSDLFLLLPRPKADGRWQFCDSDEA